MYSLKGDWSYARIILPLPSVIISRLFFRGVNLVRVVEGQERNLRELCVWWKPRLTQHFNNPRCLAKNQNSTLIARIHKTQNNNEGGKKKEPTEIRALHLLDSGNEARMLETSGSHLHVLHVEFQLRGPC